MYIIYTGCLKVGASPANDKFLKPFFFGKNVEGGHHFL